MGGRAGSKLERCRSQDRASHATSFRTAGVRPRCCGLDRCQRTHVDSVEGGLLEPGVVTTPQEVTGMFL